MEVLDPKTSALVLIDLQKGIVSRKTEPHSGEEVVATAKLMADKFRKAGATVILVHVGWSHDKNDMLKTIADKPTTPPPGGYPADFSEFVEGLKHDSDITVIKHQWGAFHGTEMDLQLRRRGIKTIVIGGISTNMGVESTLRSAWEHGYSVIAVEDMMAAASEEMHKFAVEKIFPLISKVRKAADISF